MPNFRHVAAYESVYSQFEFFQTLSVVCVSPAEWKSKQMYGKIQIVTRHFPFRMQLNASNFGIQFLSRKLKFSIYNIFKTRVLIKMFHAEFPYKLSYFEPLCLLANMAAKTVKSSIAGHENQITPENILAR